MHDKGTGGNVTLTKPLASWLVVDLAWHDAALEVLTYVSQGCLLDLSEIIATDKLACVEGIESGFNDCGA
jgi:hypothetical protein